MIIEELDHLMDVAPTVGLVRYTDGDAMNDRIAEWFETPEGTVADLPAWGHNLVIFKHEPLDDNLEVAVSMAITRKLPVDIENLIITGIALEALEIDLCIVRIRHMLGEYAGEVRLND